MSDLSKIYNFLASLNQDGKTWKDVADEKHGNNDGIVNRGEFFKFLNTDFTGWSGETKQEKTDIINKFWESFDTDSAGCVGKSGVLDDGALNNEEIDILNKRLEKNIILEEFFKTIITPSELNLTRQKFTQNVKNDLTMFLDELIKQNPKISNTDIEAKLGEKLEKIKNNHFAECYGSEKSQLIFKSVKENAKKEGTDIQTLIDAYVATVTETSTFAQIKTDIDAIVDKFNEDYSRHIVNSRKFLFETKLNLEILDAKKMEVIDKDPIGAENKTDITTLGTSTDNSAKLVEDGKYDVKDIKELSENESGGAYAQASAAAEGAKAKVSNMLQKIKAQLVADGYDSKACDNAIKIIEEDYFSSIEWLAETYSDLTPNVSYGDEYYVEYNGTAASCSLGFGSPITFIKGKNDFRIDFNSAKMLEKFIEIYNDTASGKIVLSTEEERQISKNVRNVDMKNNGEVTLSRVEAGIDAIIKELEDLGYDKDLLAKTSEKLKERYQKVFEEHGNYISSFNPKSRGGFNSRSLDFPDCGLCIGAGSSVRGGMSTAMSDGISWERITEIVIAQYNDLVSGLEHSTDTPADETTNSSNNGTRSTSNNDVRTPSSDALSRNTRTVSTTTRSSGNSDTRSTSNNDVRIPSGDAPTRNTRTDSTTTRSSGNSDTRNTSNNDVRTPSGDAPTRNTRRGV